MGGETSGKGDKKKGHVCPPSDAVHPSERWETAFVYGFITKFTNLKEKVEGLQSPVDLEDALLFPTQHPYLVQILSRFILNLKPQTRNTNPDQLSATLQTVLQEYMKSNERTLFWDDELKINVDPLQNVEGGFWGADWDLKLRILRQMVELQLSHHHETREAIDRAWGVVHNKHKKKEVTATTPLDVSDPNGMEKLSTIPIGQDIQRRRYWAFDDSPRLYVSTNPWKITATFKSISTTKEDYLKIIEELKSTAPSFKGNEKKSKIEIAHLALITTLESRIEAIDAEIARIQKVRKKIEQRELRELRAAQVEVRETRTRRQTRRPDYVYNDDIESDAGDDNYNFQEDFDDEDQLEADYDDLGSDVAGPSRRSTNNTRRSLRNANGKRPSVENISEWRGERRSSRITSTSEAPQHKRARTEESSVSDAQSRVSDQKLSTAPAKKESAAAVKSHEVVMEQVAGKKKSRYWFYAVEHIGGQPQPPAAASDTSTTQTNGSEPHQQNGSQQNGTKLLEVAKSELGDTNGHAGSYETVLSPSSSSGTLNISQ